MTQAQAAEGLRELMGANEKERACSEKTKKKKTEVREKGSWLMDEDDCQIKEDFAACRGAAMSPHIPLCQLSFSKRNEESKSRQLKGTETSPKRF